MHFTQVVCNLIRKKICIAIRFIIWVILEGPPLNPPRIITVIHLTETLGHRFQEVIQDVTIC